MSQLEEKKLPNEVKAGLKREEKQKKVDWWKKHWKWVVPSVVAGLVAVIALLLLIVTSIIADIQSRQTLKVLKACLSDVEVSEDMTELVVPSNRCNSEEVTRLDLGRFKKLKKIEVGSYSFESVGEVRVSGLSELESVVVGESSFSTQSGSFTLTDCKAVKVLSFSDGSMKHFSGLSIGNVPQLESIVVGENCFENGSELRIVGLKGLKSVVIGEKSFTKSAGQFRLVDCKVMETLSVGSGSFSLFDGFKIENVGALASISIGDGCFKNVDEVKLIGLGGLKSVVIGVGCFSNKSGAFYLKECPLVKELRVGNGAFKSYGSCIIESTPSLEMLAIGSSCFDNADSLVLNGFAKLKSVVIGEGSFTQKSGRFSLSDCSVVKELRIGDGAFTGFTSFTVTKTPVLETVVVGHDCFKPSSLEMSGEGREWRSR